MKEFTLIRKWAEERNLIKGSTPKKQMLKLYEEFGELAGAIAKQNETVIKDSIGDCVVVLVILAEQLDVKIDLTLAGKLYSTDTVDRVLNIGSVIGELSLTIMYESVEDWAEGEIYEIFDNLMCLSKELGYDFEECVRIAYDEIKDRKGKMIDGVFIKKEDLPCS